MKVRYVAAAALVAALAVGVTTAGAKTAAPSGSTRAAATTITVWLQTDAQSGWPQIVAAANRAFQAQHSGVDVKVEYQGWGDHLTKFDAALAGGDAPDVIELGNTETTKYMAAGALRQLTAANYPNAKTWLPGLKASCTFKGRTFCVPYYAGARAVIYRKDFYRQAGIKGTPKSLAEFVADGKMLMKKYGKDRNFSAVYFPGKYWYAAMSFVYDYGGQIATLKDGKWQGTLNSPQAIRGLTAWKTAAQSLSRANKTGDEGNPQQALVFSKGHVASFIGNGWEWPYALDEKVGNPSLSSVMGAYPMPSHVKGKYMPTFLGGSDLAIPITSKQVSLAADWVKAFTSTSSMRQLATDGKVIPNTTTLTGINASNPQLAPFAKAATSSWFVPTAPNWANVENANVLQNMLVRIVTNRASVASAARSASSQITRILNAST
jgi:N,N'-diacetylchitobiose transport system substrate-binding protein